MITDDEIDAIPDPAERLRQRGRRRDFETRALRYAMRAAGLVGLEEEAESTILPALADALPHGVVRRLGDRDWSPWQWLADREDHTL